MKVDKKIMYHYHKKGIYDAFWKAGKEILVDENFHSHYGTIINGFCTSVHCMPDNHLESFDRVIKYYLKEKEIDAELL